MSKIYLTVNKKKKKDGQVIPTSIIWEDGRLFAIDKVLDIRRAACLKNGGIGIRYICKICGKTVVIYDEHGKWFMDMV